MKPSELKEGENFSQIRGKIEIWFGRDYTKLECTIGPITTPEFNGDNPEYHEQLINVYFDKEEDYDTFFLALKESTEKRT